LDGIKSLGWTPEALWENPDHGSRLKNLDFIFMTRLDLNYRTSAETAGHSPASARKLFFTGKKSKPAQSGRVNVHCGTASRIIRIFQKSNFIKTSDPFPWKSETLG
jgi:hypothetical protein